MPFQIRSATAALVVATSVVTLLVQALDRTGYSAIYGGFIPARLSGADLPEGFSALPAWLTPLSCTFLHAGVFHLGMNMLMLGFTGKESERVVGPAGLIILYVVGAYASAFAQWAMEPMEVIPMVGASGAASAIVGAYSLYYRRAGAKRVRAIGPIPASVVHILWLAVGWTLINLLMWWALLGEGMQIAAAAHVGGFLAGLILARPLLWWRWRNA
ncbi:rhomboid family intramembrane serine protease [Stakelama tenebrarum]|uniref:Rhomboid family intramembrane serine protease n=1 Tax=Stakelama tenebrarum TaxID=2711215 RepID=A0A6G6Y6B2_9SPHN|nr:rhomboid family intramembrane serine protease [Sphingosinithalassobacter tenebrarum]QIG80472.1 rhomboid family intramembrane serine protease [Sphingosinithalassobacter tenebrarum]